MTAPDERPPKCIPTLEQVPEQLHDYLQFICWRYEWRNDRWTKVPVNPRNGKPASVDDAATWADLEGTLQRAVELDCDGIGFVFTRTDPFCGVDLDHCLNLQTGEVTEQAATFVEQLDSYTEVSPSGTGLHVLVRGKPTVDRQRGSGVEVYGWDHYLTITGRAYGGSSTRIKERRNELQSLCAQLFGDEPQPATTTAPQDKAQPVELSDNELIAKAKSARNGDWFTALWEGRWQELGYESQSEADFALMGSLRFWTGGDEERMVALFRASGLMRAKATRDDYLVSMARKLIDAGGDVYAETQAPEATYLVAGAANESDAGDWPAPLADAAFHGVIGEAVRIIEPHCEGDPAALLVNALVTFGSLVGSKPHMRVARDLHPARLFAVTVGETAKARKGLTWNFIKYLFTGVDSTLPNRISDGLSSGEGLISAVRDSVIRDDKDGLPEIVDEGVDDKRLLIVESEFASVLEVGKRAGNTLSPVIRSAWDSGDLNTMVKNSPTRATGAHISILGHITREELLRKLDSTDIANGFANRFLFVAAQRSKLLAFGDELDDAALDDVRSRLNEALTYVQKMGRMKWADETRPLWTQQYERLSEGSPGLLGHLTARSEAQVLRMAVVYALADRSTEIRPEHLRAALEVWRYVHDSTRYIFGVRTGDDVADRIREALRGRPAGLSRTDIRNLFSHHQTEARIETALQVLHGLGQAWVEIVPTAGRPREVWHATDAT